MVEPGQSISYSDRRDEQQARVRVVALRCVAVQGHFHLREAVSRFYGQVLGLGVPGAMMEAMGSLLLVFPNEGPDLLVRLTGQPDIWVNRLRVVMEVEDFAGLRQRLTEAGTEHQMLTGWVWPDQRLGLWDPCGNRLEVKRLWARW
jgi:extradiol dioxygenase family protein